MTFQVITAGFYCTLYVLFFGAFSQAGLYAFDLWYCKRQKLKSNETAGLIFGAISLVYSLILAFVIVAVWTDYEDLNTTIGKEADKLNDILAHSSQLPDSIRYPINNALTVYCRSVVTKEWTLNETEAAMLPSTVPPLRMLLMRTGRADKLQEGVLTIIDEDLNRISDLRRERLDHVRSHVPEVVWLILKAGTVVLIIFSYFLDVPFIGLKRVYLFFLSSMMGMSLFLVDVLNDPFIGSVAISKKPYENIIRNIGQQQPYFSPKN